MQAFRKRSIAISDMKEEDRPEWYDQVSRSGFVGVPYFKTSFLGSRFWSCPIFWPRCGSVLLTSYIEWFHGSGPLGPWSSGPLVLVRSSGPLHW